MAKQAVTKRAARKLNGDGVPHKQATKIAGKIVDNALTRSRKEPEAFSDSFTTEDATFSVEVKNPWGECVEDIEIKIDCGGAIHGDEDTIDLLIEMLEKARDNYLARKGPAATKAYWSR
jgi:hypothetical protein